MKKFISLLFLGIFLCSISVNYCIAQAENNDTTVVEEGVAEDQGDVAPEVSDKAIMEATDTEEQENLTAHQIIKKWFIDGGPAFMGIVLVCLILGLAFAIERIIMLSLSTVNPQQLLIDVDKAMGEGGADAAKELCKSTRGPIASIFCQGLDRAKEGIEVVEKSIVSYGSVEMGKLEKGLIWISLFIALAPMLGFMGTVIGMVDAFNSIEIAGDISPSLVAGGIKVALLTTLFGLIVAVILQVFYNYIISKIDGIVNNMEESSIALVDLMIKHNIVKK